MEVKGDFCRQVRAILTQGRTRRRLHRDRPRHRRLLQPAAQRPRSVCGGLRHCHAAQQPVRTVEGAVLAAGLHGPPEVRDPAPAADRRLHHVLGGLPIHPGRLADRPRHPSPEERPVGGPGLPADCDARLPPPRDRSAPGRIGSRTMPTRWRTRTMRSSRRTWRRKQVAVRRRSSEGRRVGRAEAPARGAGALVRERLESARRAAPVVHHRRRRRVPVAVR